MNSPVRHALVLGLGASGCAAARLLRGEGTDVTGVDRTPRNLLSPEALALADEGMVLHVGSDALPALESFDLAVVSPGVPIDSPWILACRAAGLPVQSEVDIGWQRFAGPVIAVTGSNGKSTVVKWLADWLSADGVSAVACGNYGLPVTAAVSAPEPPDLLVVEVSSYQLETCDVFRPDIAVMLNLAPNHLERHGTMDAYRAAKLRLFRHLGAGQTAVVHQPWVDAVREILPPPATLVTFGDEDEGGDVQFHQGKIVREGDIVADFRDTRFGRAPWGINAAAVVAVCHALGRSRSGLEASARDFQPLPHRMETIARFSGIEFINDSKASTLTATAAALQQIDRPVHLIAGGLLKENDLTFLKEILAKSCAGIYSIGKCAETLNQAWGDVVRVQVSGTLDQAFADAVRVARAGEVILLSPGCASFDQFRGYEHRGETFRERVRTYSGETRHDEKR
jgi:UDP-N-acetylmuramoylalanine--D-glutamate ligase